MGFIIEYVVGLFMWWRLNDEESWEDRAWTKLLVLSIEMI